MYFLTECNAITNEYFVVPCIQLVKDIRKAAHDVMELRKKIGNWIKNRNHAITTLNNLAAAARRKQGRSNTFGASALAVGLFGWGAAIIAAPFTAGGSLVAATAATATFAGVTVGTLGILSSFISNPEEKLKLEEAQDQLKKDIPLAKAVNGSMRASKLSLACERISYMFSGKYNPQETLSIIIDACECKDKEGIMSLMRKYARETQIPELSSYVIDLSETNFDIIDACKSLNRFEIADLLEAKAKALMKTIQHFKTLSFV